MTILSILGEILLSGTLITLQPTTEPGAIAEVAMNNLSLNGPQDNGEYALTLDGLQVGVRFTWDAGQYGEDRLTVTPPDGIICEPRDCILQLEEDQDGKLLLIEWIGG